ncbi:MAG: hypothetical protein KIG65_08335 [Eubacteriales bacterium]|nr:hypothetical protein [Eubacteriales bacterium]
MKKMAKRFFSSVIVLAMLMALLPASVANAATLVSRRFETEADISGFPTGLWGTVAYEWDNTVAYNGQASMKAVQSGGGYGLMGVSASYEYGKTYRISARVKFDNPQNVKKNLNFEIFGDKASTTVNWSILQDTYLRARSATQTVSDGEWHLFTEEFVFTNVDNGATAKASATVGIEANYGENDTLWIDDFSIVEVLSVDENKKGSFMAFKSFDGPSTEVAGNVTRDTSTAYDGAASAKVTARDSIINFGTYNFEVGQYYRVSSYIKAQYPEGISSNNYFKYEFRNNTSGRGGVVSVSSKYNSSPETRPGFNFAYAVDEQYPEVGTGWSRLGAHPINEKDTQWLRHESYFTVNSTDPAITTADLQVWLWTNVPAGTVINVDSVKIEKLAIVKHWSGTKYGLGTYGGDIVRAAKNLADSGLLSAYRFSTSGGDNHSVFACYNLEKGKKYIASVKVFVPSSNKAAVDALGTAPKMTFGTASKDLVYDQWVDLSYEIDHTNTESAATRLVLNGINAAIAKTFYFGAIDVVEVNAGTVEASVPTISMKTEDWTGSNAGFSSAAYEGEDNALLVTKSAGYGVLYQNVELNDGQDYLLKAKFYVPKGQVGANTKIQLFVIDGEKTIIAGETSHTMTDDSGYGEVKYVKTLTAEDEGKWISVALPFTFAKPSYDTDNSYRIKPMVTGLNDNSVGYYLADVKFVDTNAAGIENLEIQANGTVTYDANAVDYMLSYEYLDGATVLASGMIMSGEFLPKFDLADVKEPTVKLTASNAYGVAEKTVVGTKAVEETPDIGGGEEGVFDVNSVTILDLEGDGVTGAQDISAISKGMYVDINYINSTAEAKQVWLMMAYYNADGLIEAKKYVVDLAVSADAKDEYYPAEPDDIPYVEGATVVKAFVWDIDGVEPLCEGYVVD